MDKIELILNIALLVVSVLLILVVLVQKGKSGSLGAAFGGDSPEFSPRAKTASREVKLQKVTVVLAVLMALLAIAIMIVPQL